MKNKANGNVVFYIGHFQFPDKDPLVHRVIANCIALNEAGYKVVMIGYDKEIDSSTDIFDTHKKIKGFDTYSIAYPEANIEWARDMFSSAKIKKVMKKYFSEGVHSFVACGSLGVPNYISLLTFAKINGIHAVSDSVDWFDTFAGNFIRRMYKKFDAKIYNDMLKPRMKNIITISTFLYDYYTKKHNCNCLIVPPLFYNGDSRFSNLTQRDDKFLKYVFAGSPGYKGSKDRIDWSVKAFSKNSISDSVFNIYGMTLESFIDQFPELEKEAKDVRIHFHGKCENRVCIEAIAMSDYSLMAREVNQVTSAGFPSKFSECLAMGVPSVTTPTSDLKDYVVNGVNGFISDEATYESFEKAFIQSNRVTRDEIEKIHDNCKNEKRLHSLYYVDILKEYFKNLK